MHKDQRPAAGKLAPLRALMPSKSMLRPNRPGHTAKDDAVIIDSTIVKGAKGVCPLCMGAGYRRYDKPYPHPNFGKIVLCPCKEAELQEQRKAELLKLSRIGIMSELVDATFENFNILVDGVAEAYQAACDFAQNPCGFLILKGSNGCGKTHLAVATAWHCLSNGKKALFQVVPDLLDHIRATFSPASDIPYDELFDQIRDVDLLVLDDLGTQSSTPWASEKLFQIINHRYNNHSATVITTNYEINEMDPRIRSRLNDRRYSRYVNMDHVEDYRFYASE